ncbi:3-(3-hydroxy-phenyl)propionate hydroxylase [Variovorax sp. YR752]|uniref:bifunctional 3-(3-hydroxy-phenyl)propionate/3-hydroxycinnamic acid hydroxylase MhpA n=1 Tax=Variovorax sp. YR752 TaxID=1884383 RepID=UPI000BD6BF64|nr:bifunctional 3-(3-hydroxy-phenyl)propionate/3-hydroxycinnamic acid hydroxylase [Variovorax sp. YR752]SOE06285.1 3-(3-hydroxy-phenyl)propionate hydroxylase [Variovorax sp. YR752]
MHSEDVVDVAIVGYGPVSEILALALARQGRSVAVFERWEERYPLPRAVCIDHEMFRLLSSLGLREQLPTVSHAGPWYRWYNAEWKELLAIDWSAESISGGPEVHFVHQPTLETMFDEAVRAQPMVRVNLGWEAESFEQNEESVMLRVRRTSGSEVRTVKARYLVGADGANSRVRETIGASREDRGFEADWLVIDVLPHEGVTLDIPPAAQYCNPTRPTTIVPAGIRDGRYYRRWEFMRLPHETREELEDEAVAWKLLANWVGPDQCTIVRHKVYTFRSLLANQWRSGRALIAGDAAHLMPPFMGQGMCAGLRDIANLVWKLGLVLDGRADERLLDTYQIERRPHVSDVIDISAYLGRVICVSDPAKAAERDASFFSGNIPPPPPFPHLRDGFISRANIEGRAVAGLLSPHGRVRRDGVRGRFDDAIGVGWRLIAIERGALQAIGERQHQVLQALDACSVLVADATETISDAWSDEDGKFVPWMRKHGVVAMLVRPDFYVYGGARTAAEVAPLIDEFADSMAAYGIGSQASRTLVAA